MSVAPVAPPAEDYKYVNFLETFNCTTINGKIGIALFGVGRAGMIHLNNLSQNKRVNLLYVVEQDDERNKKVEATSGLETTKFVNSSKMDLVLDDPKVQGVVITTPTQTHHAIVVESLNKGKAVFCEKPIANRIKEIKDCYNLAKEKNLPLLCAFNRRFDPSFLNVRDRVRKGELGDKVHIIKSTSRDSPLPSIDYLKTSNGIFHDCAVHDIDLLCWIMGEYPTKVFSTATAHMPHIKAINDHDTVTISLTFPSGGMGNIDLSRFANYGYDQRLEVFGPGGMLQCGNQNTLGVQSYTSGNVREPPIWYSFASRYDEAYKKELEHFLDVIDGKEKLSILSTETLSVCQVASSCEESVRTGKPVEMVYDF